MARWTPARELVDEALSKLMDTPGWWLALFAAVRLIAGLMTGLAASRVTRTTRSSISNFRPHCALTREP